MSTAELLPGTLDVLILKAVSLGKLHGYGVLFRIEQISGGALLVQQGALYQALARLSIGVSSIPSGAPRRTTAKRNTTA